MRPLCIALVTWFLPGDAAQALGPRIKPPPELKKLHVLMAFDTKDERLEPGLRIDEKRMTRLFATTMPRDRYTLTVLKGERVTAQTILDYYRKRKLGPGEGALFYYGGHGANDPVKGHYLHLTVGKPLFRTE